MFISLSGERFHVLLHGALGAWVISYDFYGMPVYLDKQHLERSERIEAPEEYVANRKREMTDAQRKRYDLLKPVLEDSRCITDSGYRQECFKRIILAHNTSKRRLERLYYSYLAHGCLTQSKPRESRRRKDFDDAIRKYYFTAKRNSLRTAYELFILEHYTNNGDVQKDTPSWAAFKHYYYRHWGQDKQKDISRNGLTDYQRNNRPLYSSAMQYRDCLGCYQIDETPGDIYLVSKWDRSSVIGRPNIYLAVDTASGLIAGLYVGLEAGERAVASCLANAVQIRLSIVRSMELKSILLTGPVEVFRLRSSVTGGMSLQVIKWMRCVFATVSTARRFLHFGQKKSRWWNGRWV